MRYPSSRLGCRTRPCCWRTRPWSCWRWRSGGGRTSSEARICRERHQHPCQAVTEIVSSQGRDVGGLPGEDGVVLGGGRGGLLQLLLAAAPAAGGRPAQRAQHRRRPLHHPVRLESHRSAFSGKYFEYSFDVVKIFFTQTYIQRYMANAINNPSIYKVTDYLTLSQIIHCSLCRALTRSSAWGRPCSRRRSPPAGRGVRRSSSTSCGPRPGPAGTVQL